MFNILIAIHVIVPLCSCYN